MKREFLWKDFCKQGVIVVMFYDNQKTLLIQNQLERCVGKKLQLKINDNRSTMLSVKWEPACTKVSMHRMFLQAPQHIMHALTCYIKRKDKKLDPSIKAFIENHLQTLDYSHELDHSKLETNGNVYNLQSLYQKINNAYFEEPLALYISWFGEGKRTSCKRITFGLYHDPLRLIKINRLLDNIHFPEFFVSYVIFHEMLHSVYPSYIDERGIKRIHTKAFKAHEKEFKYYKQAQQWIRDNQIFLFKGSRLHYGRS